MKLQIILPTKCLCQRTTPLCAIGVFLPPGLQSPLTPDGMAGTSQGESQLVYQQVYFMHYLHIETNDIFNALSVVCHHHRFLSALSLLGIYIILGLFKKCMRQFVTYYIIFNIFIYYYILLTYVYVDCALCSVSKLMLAFCVMVRWRRRAKNIFFT